MFRSWWQLACQGTGTGLLITGMVIWELEFITIGLLLFILADKKVK